MTDFGGAGGSPVVPGGPGPRVVAVAPLTSAPEHCILQAVRRNRLLDRLRKTHEDVCRRRNARFLGVLAAITSTLVMVFNDALFGILEGQPVSAVVERHREPLEAVSVIYQLCDQQQVLEEWGFSPDQIEVTVRQQGNFVGYSGVRYCKPDPPELRFTMVAQPEPPAEEAPFLAPVMFLLLSRRLPLLALASCLARARFGVWSRDRRVFFPRQMEGQGLGLRWGVQTGEAPDLGVVHVYFEGDNITTFRFAEAWPKARFRSGRHLMDERFRLPEVELARRPAVFQTVKSSDGLTWAKPFWYKYFGNSLAAELETILDGHFCIAKDGLPLRPIFMRNHPSLEDDPLAQKALFRVLAAWLDAGSPEYVERWHRLPHCILACGSVPKNTEPYRRLITDARPIMSMRSVGV